MTPTDAALALLALLKLPDGAANVLVWHESDAPSLRVWVDPRYLWDAKRRAPPVFENYAVLVEPRPDIAAQKNIPTHPSIAEMTGIRPQTIGNTVTDSLEALHGSADRFVSPSDLRVIKLNAEIKKLAGADAFTAHVSWGVLHQLMGDTDKMRYHFLNAGKIGDRIHACEHFTVGELNMGYASRAQDLFRQSADPETGNFTSAYRLGANCGAFQLMAAYTERAEQMHIDLSGLNTATNRRAAAVLKSAGVSDAEAATMLDLAGEVLREHKMFSGEADVTVDDQGPRGAHCVYVRYNIAADAYETAQLFDQLADRIAHRIDPIPDAFHVSYRPGDLAA